MTHPTVNQRLEAIWHLESAPITGYLTRLLGDLSEAEDIAQDTLMAALEHWQQTGVPTNPGGWLMTTARNKAIDRLRQLQRHGVSQTDSLPEASEEFLPESLRDSEVGDEVLRLMFICCHPLLAPDARVALVLKLVSGLTVADIARAYLVPEATLAQRITRAKRTLKTARIAFELPPAKERQARIQSVLEAIYLLFNEGYVATQGTDWMQPALCHQALRLARSLAALVPDDTEVLGLASLLEFQASRLNARVDQQGQPILLMEQNRTHWDSLLMRRGHNYLDQAFRLESAIGSYCLQAGIAACHAVASSPAETSWEDILGFYDALVQIQPTPVVRLNRALALAEVEGPELALTEVEYLIKEGSLSQFAPLHATLGDLLQRLKHFAKAEAAFLRAAELSSNQAESQILRKRGLACATHSPQDRNSPQH